VAGGSNHTARFGIARHGENINLAFVDGHVSKVPLTDLHQYLWKPRWRPKPLSMPGT
jgi:prepilin-type processing-associated H-X9-DG protein